MKALYLDCPSGISGNMFLGACIQLGVPEKFLRQELDKLNLSKEYVLEISDAVKNGIGAAYANVVFSRDVQNFEPNETIKHEHNGIHHHHHEHHEHRNLTHIRHIIEDSSLSDSVKSTALKIFTGIAAAEGKVHRKPADEVHFHEVGAVDSIVDIVGCAICLEYLGVEKIFVGRINVGSGFVKCAHGLMPVPAPATAELLQKFKTYNYEVGKELTTPTGAAIVAALAEFSANLPEEFVSERIGYGAGSHDLPIPNVLRVYLGEYSGQAERKLVKLETNIDDMNPQIYGWLYGKLFKAGALDVWTQNIYMKKNRPAQMLSVLVDSEHQADCAKIIFEETTTLGLRVVEVERIEATRKMAKVETSYGEVQCKVSAYDGKIVSITPEYEDCRRLAEEKNVPLKLIWQEALATQQARLS